MIFIQDVELTPNPQALKFILNKEIIDGGARHYSTEEEASRDPFAEGIFRIHGVKSIFYTRRFITIEKEKDINWGKIQKQLVEFVKNFDESLIPEFEEGETPQLENGNTLRKINSALDNFIRPALENDGGGLQIIDFKNNVLKIRYQGACGSCPAAIQGTLVAIENLLRKEVDKNITVKVTL